jgi:hypothetical protein
MLVGYMRVSSEGDRQTTAEVLKCEQTLSKAFTIGQ